MSEAVDRSVVTVRKKTWVKHHILIIFILDTLERDTETIIMLKRNSIINPFLVANENYNIIYKFPLKLIPYMMYDILILCDACKKIKKC